ncbi:MAG: twin-arginine translocase subunit TatC [Sedimentisphaerales bacterium]|nr:twin-arginine translocase subunit TatC [Sedimentisphaerales bacterium]
MGKEEKKKKKKKPQDPQDTTMSLGDHLEELRARLILAITGLLIGTGICLFFGTRIIKFIEKPYTKVFLTPKTKPQKTEETAKLVQDLFDHARRKLAADPNTPDIEPKTEEFVHKFCTEAFLALLNDPNFTALHPPSDPKTAENRLIILSPAAGFVSYIKIALMAGLILSSPWVFYQIWMFVAAGLYAHEKKYVHTAVPFSAALFVTGALFFLLVIAKLTLKFFMKFNEGVLDARSNFTFSDYISFITMLMLVFGIAFQTPIAIFFLNRTGLVSIQSLRKSRKFVILGIFIIAAMATPPDPISQVTLAIPLYFLFELGIILSVFSERKRKAQEQTA